MLQKTRVLTQSLVDDFIYSNQCILDYEQERIAEHEFNIRKQAKYVDLIRITLSLY